MLTIHHYSFFSFYTIGTNYVQGGQKRPGDRGAATAANKVPGREPDCVVEEKTTEEQAVLYRLSGDYK